MRDRAVETFRIALTILGLVLLVVFGTRAAHQASNMKLAGANHRSLFAASNSLHAAMTVGAPIFADFTVQPKAVAHTHSSTGQKLQVTNATARTTPSTLSATSEYMSQPRSAAPAHEAKKVKTHTPSQSVTPTPSVEAPPHAPLPIDSTTTTYQLPQPDSRLLGL